MIKESDTAQNTCYWQCFCKSRIDFDYVGPNIKLNWMYPDILRTANPISLVFFP